MMAHRSAPARARLFPLHRALCAGALLLAGCAAQYVYAPTREGPSIEVIAAATSGLNTDESGQPNAVVLRIYQLADSTDFQRAEPEAFWESDERVLRDALIDQQVLILQPGSEARVQVQLRPDTRFVGVAANFIRPQMGRWRDLYSLAARRRELRVMVREDHLTLEAR